MKITRLDDTLDQLVLEASPARTPGLHLSTIIRSLCNVAEPGKYKGGPVDPLYTDPGFTFERVLEMAWVSRHAGNIVRPGEFEHDGILCSPDYLDFTNPTTPELVESKMTEMSMVGCPTEPKFRKWLWQIGSYCKVLGVTQARLHVLWLKGNYKEIRRAYTVDRIEFTQAELDHTWGVIVRHARDKGWLVEGPEGLVAADGMPWERAA